MIDIEFAESGRLVLIRSDKVFLVFTRAQFLAAVKRGKGYQRHAKLQAKLTAEPQPSATQTPETLEPARYILRRHARRWGPLVGWWIGRSANDAAESGKNLHELQKGHMSTVTLSLERPVRMMSNSTGKLLAVADHRALPPECQRLTDVRCGESR
jgi:hypothetical protein